MYMALTHEQIALALGCSRQYVGSLVAKGMPTESIEAAKDWRSKNQPRGGDRSNRLRLALKNVADVVDSVVATDDQDEEGLLLANIDVDGEDFGHAVRRLRQLEKAYADALARSTRERWTPEARQRQRDHINTLRALAMAERQLMVLEQQRGRLITVEAAEQMVLDTLKPMTDQMRRIPSRYKGQIRQIVAKVINEIFEAARDGATKSALAQSEAMTAEDTATWVDIEKQEVLWRSAAQAKIEEETRQRRSVTLRLFWALCGMGDRLVRSIAERDGYAAELPTDRMVCRADLRNYKPTPEELTLQEHLVRWASISKASKEDTGNPAWNPVEAEAEIEAALAAMHQHQSTEQPVAKLN
jgi:hypothetical protein